MSIYNADCPPSSNYCAGKNSVLASLETMKQAMQKMGAEHVKFHDNFADIQKRLENMKKTSSDPELNVEITRVTVLDKYLPNVNLSNIMTFRRLELEKALKKFSQKEEKLEDLQKKTKELVELLSGDRDPSPS